MGSLLHFSASFGRGSFALRRRRRFVGFSMPAQAPAVKRPFCAFVAEICHLQHPHFLRDVRFLHHFSYLVVIHSKKSESG